MVFLFNENVEISDWAGVVRGWLFYTLNHVESLFVRRIVPLCFTVVSGVALFTPRFALKVYLSGAFHRETLPWNRFCAVDVNGCVESFCSNRERNSIGAGLAFCHHIYVMLWRQIVSETLIVRESFFTPRMVLNVSERNRFCAGLRFVLSLCFGLVYGGSLKEPPNHRPFQGIGLMTSPRAMVAFGHRPPLPWRAALGDGRIVSEDSQEKRRGICFAFMSVGLCFGVGLIWGLLAKPESILGFS